MFAAKTLLIVGGTGTFGNAVLRRFLSTDFGEIGRPRCRARRRAIDRYVNRTVWRK